MNKLYCTLVLLLGTSILFSQTQFIGADGGDWQTATNWSNGLPANGNDALITGTGKPAINNPLIIDYGVTSFGGEISINADVFNTGNVVNSGGNVSLAPGVQFVNSGSVTFTNDGPFSNDGIFINYGNFNQNGSGTFDNNASGVFINYGTISNIGNFTNNGMVENRGSLTNAATYVNNSLTTNYGSFINTFVSTLENNVTGNFVNATGGQLFLDNVFNNAGLVNDDGSTTVNASGNVNNTGTMNLNGLFVMSIAFANNGTVNNGGNFKVNFGTLDNNSLWVNTGFTENVGTFNNNIGATLTNNDALMNASCSRFYQYSNNPISNMTNDGVLYELGAAVGVNGSSQGRVLTNANDVPQPFLDCRDIQIQTDDQGNAVITAGDVLVDADAKYCNIVTISLDQTNFTCADLGLNPVTVTMTDGFGESTTCNPTVTVVERSPNPCANSFLNYCASASTNNSTEYIQSVSLTDIANVSGNNNGYADFTTQIATLEFGNFYDLELTPGFPGNAQDEAWIVWIDWNNDGDFDDVAEEVVNEISQGTVNGIINVPGVALPGTTRMRVSMQRGTTATSCQTFTHGEVEDYTVMIVSDITIQNCVGDIVVNAFAGATEANVGWIPPKGFSTCQNSIDIEQIGGLSNGSAFPLGETINTFRFYDGCDNADTCSFTVTVDPTPVNFSLTCPGDVLLAASPGLGGAIANWVAPFPSATCQAGVNLPTQVTGPPLGAFLPIGSVTTICYETTDNCGNADNCCFDVFVSDPAESITIDNCPNSISVDAAPGQPGTVVTYPNLTATSTCPTGGVAVVLQDGLPSGSYFPGGNTVVTYRASDNCNSADLCSFTVSVTGVPAEITQSCPDDVVIDVAPGAFNQTVNLPAVSATSTCAGGVNIIQTQGLPSGSMFPLGNTVVQFMIADQCGGMDNCTFNVTLNSTASTLNLTCPADVTIDAAPGEVGAIATWNNPGLTTDCFSAGAEFSLVSPLPSGSIFPLGAQEVIYFANDDCGNTAGCSFFVTVNPVSANLTLNCPADIILTKNINANNPTATWTTPSGSTTCSGNVNVTKISGPNSGASFEPGSTPINYQATDACGNVEFCTFNVIVNVNTPADDPAIDLTCIADITVTAGAGQNSASVGFDVPTATTNCGTGGGSGGSSICLERQISNVTHCSGTYDYGVWLDFNGLHPRYQFTAGTFTEFDDGTAVLEGSLVNNLDATIQFEIQSNFSGRTTTAPNIPKSHACLTPDVSQFYFYENFTGTLTGQGSAAGAFLTFYNVQEAFQVGPGASVTGNDLGFGASAWYEWNIISQPTGALTLAEGVDSPLHDGDFNILLSGDPATCDNDGLAFCTDVSENINGFTFVGEFENSKYYMSTAGMNWTAARDLAAANGGHLVVFNSQAENDFIWNNTLPSSGSIWTGGSNFTAGDSIFSWENGEQFSYTNWLNGEPNETHNAVAIRQRNDNGMWTDRVYSNLYNAVLEIECGSGAACNRVTDQLQVLYDFKNSSGSLVPDVSGVGVPLNLMIANPANTSWIPSGGLSINSGTIISSGAAATKIIDAVKATNALTFEAWVAPQNTTQTGPSRIMTISENTSLRNATLGQNAGTYAARLRNSSGGNTNGIPTIYGGVVETNLQHVVYTRGSGGNERIYVNGVQVYTGTRTGNLSNWDDNYQLALINELTGDRNWLGQIYLAAVYSKKLSTAEVVQNYNEGTSCGSGGNTGGSGVATVSQIEGLAPNSQFPVGTTTVLFEATDDCGNAAYCEFDVIVNPPASTLQINNCPTDITVTAAAGATSAVASWTAPTGNSDCTSGSVTVSQVGGFANGTDFPIGQTTVSYRAVDGCGNEQFCTFFVTVEATPEPPTSITENCLQNTVVTTQPGAGFANVNWNLPPATTTCPGSSVEILQIGGLAPGSNFPIGNTVIFYRLEDDCGNVASCAFNVTVNSVPSDVSITCPGNVSVDTAPDSEFASATWTDPTATSDCYTGTIDILQIGGLPKGSLFPVGNNIITYKATDACGQFAVCNFIVTINATPITNIDPCVNNGGDMDGDGVCADVDCDDMNPLVSSPGDACNDNDPGTENDVIQADCSCAGTLIPFDCPALMADIGDTCDDGDATTENDLVQADCSCAGTPVQTFDCPALMADIGDTCDDGDTTTENDLVQADCSCAGTPFSTTCEVTYTVNGTIVDIINLNAPITTAKIFDNGFNQIFGCDNFGGTPCLVSESINLPGPGTYFISVQTYIDWTTPVCDFFETITIEAPGPCDNQGGDSDGDGICDNVDPCDNNTDGTTCDDGDATTENDVFNNCVCAGTPIGQTFDCPALMADIGDTCDDGNANTNNDIVLADCTCAGTPVQTGCNATWTVDGFTITLENLSSPITAVKVLDNFYNPIFSCDDWTTVCGNIENVTVPAAGDYFIQIQTYQDWSTPLCDIFETVTVAGVDPCLGLGGDSDGDGICDDNDPCDNNLNGTTCDDGDANTENDVYDNNCNCAGTPIGQTYDCPALSANIGDTCDDGDTDTNNDTIQENCVCAGTPVQTGCNATYTVNGMDIELNNIGAAISSVTVFDNAFVAIFNCNNFGGTPCNNSEIVTTPLAGTYFVSIQTYADWNSPLCNIFETVTITGGGPNNNCDPVTDGGIIIGDETVCPTDNPTPISNSDVPTGGSGLVEYIWVSSTTTCPTSANNPIAGATQSTYDPGSVSQTTYFRRYARRAGCTDWLAGESNCIVKTLNTDCVNNNQCTATWDINGLEITLNNIGANISAVKVLDQSFLPVFSCDDWTTVCNNTETVTVPAAGDYFIQIQTYEDWSTPVCNIFETVTVSGNAPLQRNNDNTQISTPNRLDLNYEKSIADFKVFPNPAHDHVKIGLNEFLGKNVQIRLVNQLGMRIQNISLPEVKYDTHQIDLSSIHDGIYTLTIFADGQKPVSKKLVVRRN